MSAPRGAPGGASNGAPNAVSNGAPKPQAGFKATERIQATGPGPGRGPMGGGRSAVRRDPGQRLRGELHHLPA